MPATICLRYLQYGGTRSLRSSNLYKNSRLLLFRTYESLYKEKEKTEGL